MPTNYPGAIDDETTLVDTRAIGDPGTADDNNAQNLAIKAIEAKVGFDASTATAGKVLVGQSTAGHSAWQDVINALPTPVPGYVLGLNIDGTSLVWVNPSASGGEANTASNRGSVGLGWYDSKNGVDLRFRNIDTPNATLSIVLNNTNHTLEVDVIQSALTLGSIGGTLPINKGGTGQTGKTAAFTGLSPMSALGDTMYHDGSNAVVLSGNTTGTKKFLAQTGSGSASAAPAWSTLVAGDIPSITAAKISDLATVVQAYTLDQFGAPAGNVAWNSKRITGLADPVGAQDAATKAYVDGIATGLDLKASVRAATTASIANLSSVSTTLDGITLVQGDRVLVKDTASIDGVEALSGKRNGIYVVGLVTTGTAPWTRASDANVSAEVTSGMYTYVSEGTVNGSNGYVLTTADPITLDTTVLAFTQFSGAGQIVAGAGLTKTGNTLDIGAGTGITVNADTIQISASYSGQTSIVTLGTVVTGVWNGTAIAAANGGTGQTTYAKGDILASPGSNTLNKLAVGTDGQYLVADAASTNGVKWSGFVAPGSNKNLLFNDGGSTAAGADQAYWDKTNHRLGLGTASTPGSTLDVGGDVNIAATFTLKLQGTAFMSNAGATTNVLIGTSTPHTTIGTGGNNTVVGSGAGAALVTTGASNTLIGAAAGAAITTGLRNVIIGASAAQLPTTQNDTVAVGWNVAPGNAAAGGTYVGQQAGGGQGGNTSFPSTAVGYQAGYSDGNSTANSVFIGYQANPGSGGGTSGNRLILIGDSASNNSASFPSDMLCIGYQAIGTAENQVIIGGTSNMLNHWYIGRGKTSTTAAAIDFQASDRTGTNVAGNSFILGAGIGTGTGAKNYVALAVPYKRASGTTAQTRANRLIVAQDVTLTDAATNLFEVALPTLTMTGGQVLWTIEASDGTDMQAYSGICTWSAVNKAGTYTTQITQDANPESKAVSAGTLTATWDILNGTNKVTIRVTPAGSLTETTYRISFTIICNTPQAITLL